MEKIRLLCVCLVLMSATVSCSNSRSVKNKGDKPETETVAAVHNCSGDCSDCDSADDGSCSSGNTAEVN